MKLRNKDTGEDGRLMMCRDYDEYPFFIEIGSIKIYYHNFAEMIEAGWDCVKIPAEPLIKDEKIRKAVRAWAEVNGLDDVVYDSAWNAFRKYDFTICFDYFFDENDGLVEGKEYTIAELCGEEEE